MTLFQALCVDAVCVIGSLIAILFSQRPALVHPGIIYLIFHVSVISTRAWALLGGAAVTLRLTEHEATRAVLISDLLLVSLVVGWRMRVLVRPARGTPAAVDSRAVFWVGLVAFPVGMFSLMTTAYIPGRDNSFVFTTSYQIFAIAWPGLMLLALIYRYGFRWPLVLGLGVYLSLMAVQGYGRYRVVIPLLLVTQLWLDLRRRRWPTPAMVVGLLLLVVVFIPLKELGVLAQEGRLDRAGAQQVLSESVSTAGRGENTEQSVFDQYAVSLTLSDRHPPGLGNHYLDLLALPVPRTMWPDKPGTAEHIKEISTLSRPLSGIGAVVTLPGELYYDFRLIGIIAVGVLLGRASQRVYLTAYDRGYGTVSHFVYLLLAASLIQVYRDGLVSIPVFLLVNSSPLVAIAILSRMMSKERRRAQLDSMQGLLH